MYTKIQKHVLKILKKQKSPLQLSLNSMKFITPHFVSLKTINCKLQKSISISMFFSFDWNKWYFIQLLEKWIYCDLVTQLSRTASKNFKTFSALKVELQKFFFTNIEFKPLNSTLYQIFDHNWKCQKSFLFDWIQSNIFI